MSKEILVSLCIPTNGILEWVLPVLESIYNQSVDRDLFEVIVTDNGTNTDFQKQMQLYSTLYENMIYKETTAVQFQNQIEAFKLASGQLIKFVNHRMIFKEGALQHIIDIVRKNKKNMTPIYFSNGVLGCNKVIKYDSFDMYIKRLSYWSSWSAGTAIWKEQFRKLDLNKNFNSLFPHTDILFLERHMSEYLIDDYPIMQELIIDESKKGQYDIFFAFAVEFPSLILELFRTGDIHLETFEYVLKNNRKFIAELYFKYCIKKEKCSYILSGYNDAIQIYYSKWEINKEILIKVTKSIIGKIRLLRK